MASIAPVASIASIASVAPVPTTLSTGETLQPGALYRVRIHVPPALLCGAQTHAFLWDRVMRYEGQDTAWVHARDVGLVLSDDVQLFDVMANDLDAYHAFASMAHVCTSQIDKDSKRWAVHICERRHTGEQLLQVCERML